MDLVGPATEPLPPTADSLLARIGEQAADADVHGVRRDVIDALAAQGLLGSVMPSAMRRELAERLAMADASTWFCWAQHQTPVTVLEGVVPGLVAPASESLRSELLMDLQRGTRLAAVAFAHVRRLGPPDPVATRTGGGWRFDGHLDWVTSWDIADEVMVMAQGAAPHDGTLVCAFLPGGASPMGWPGVTPGSVLELLAMSGTHTRPLTLTAVNVPDERVVVIDREAWLAADAIRTSDVNPAAFGVARGAIDELDEIARVSADAITAHRVRELAEGLAGRCREIRSAAYSAADADAPVPLRRALRAQALELAVMAATGVVTARAGAAMQRGRSAERRLREAMFLQVQAQTADTRAASLDLMLHRVRGGSPAHDDALGG